MKSLLVFVCALLLGLGPALAENAAAPADARQLWQLLDYVAVDYGGAVASGKVASASEYAEMLDFTDNASRQVQALPPHASKPAVAEAVAALRAAVMRKADSAEVAQLAHRANALLIAAYPIPVAPKTTPDLARGKALFSSQCASCHGALGGGDGPLAASLDPKPIAFTDRERARARSLMALYQAVSQGVAGTSMPAFAALTDEDRWAVAFYAGGLSYDDAMRSRGEKLWQSDPAVKRRFPDMAAVTTLAEAEAVQGLPADTARDAAAYLRSNPSAVESGKPGGLALSRQRLKESLAALRAGYGGEATRLGLSAYLDGFEPLEPTLGARNKSLLVAVEDAMLNYRAAVARAAVPEAEATARRLEQLFTQVEAELGEAQADPATTFVGALTILLREGVEALLIVIGMIAFLKKAGNTQALRYVHGGWTSALAAGGLTWVVATYLVAISGASREVTEGVGSVFAAVVLLSVGLWMHQKSSAGKWQAYLHEKMSSAMSQRSSWALFALAFIAVYREVFETVLFYSALAADGNGGALLGGFLTAVVLLGVVAAILLRTSARMPIGKFFSYTSILVAVLAVVLVGKGMSALQEAGWVGVVPVAGPRIEMLGVYPTAETLLAQLVVLAIAMAGFGFNVRSSRKAVVA